MIHETKTQIEAAVAAEKAIQSLCRQSKIQKRSTLSGLQWGDINIESTIGVGGYSKVLKVRSDKLTSEAFALKSLRPKLIDSDTDFETGLVDLAAEGEMLMRLEHENIINIHAVSNGGLKQSFHDDRRGYFLILDYLPGGTLKTKLKSSKNGRMTKLARLGKISSSDMIARINNIGLGIAKGVAHLHEKGVVLRDLKPQNVGFDANGVPKLFDFGFAREIHTIAESEMAGSLR